LGESPSLALRETEKAQIRAAATISVGVMSAASRTTNVFMATLGMGVIQEIIAFPSPGFSAMMEPGRRDDARRAGRVMPHDEQHAAYPVILPRRIDPR
jgi:hypothetical protein